VWRPALVSTAILLAGCQCGGGSTSASGGPAASASAAPAPAPERADAAPRFPEVRDVGAGRATAALRSALGGYGIEFDAAALAQACKVGQDGASIDDLEEAARARGLDVTQTLVPPEHVLTGGARLLPAIAVLEGAIGARDFVLLVRVDGDKVEVMDPRDGLGRRPRVEISHRLHPHEMRVSATAFRETVRSDSFAAALRDRMAALGLQAAASTSWVERAGAAPGYRGLAALDAALRRAEGDPPRDAGAALEAALACAVDRRCASGEAEPAARFWSVRPTDDAGPADAEVTMRGTVLLSIAGRAQR
jgi:Peptidase C39 family